MLIYAGIDEAGYGPLLGPLCVGCTIFVLEGHEPTEGAPNLWKILQRVVCRRVKDTRRRIAVEDSKKLKGANSSVRIHPLKHLERGVLSFCAAQGESPKDDAQFFSGIGATLPSAAWCEQSTALPVAHTADELRITGSRLARGLDAAGVECAAVRCEALHPEQFNRQVEQTNNKASVNFAAAMRLVDAVWKRWPVAHPRIILDRHGGRVRYREELQLAWPDAAIQILAEDEAISRYRLDRGGSLLTVTFIPEAEQKHFPVALASMTAKYARELFMMRLNRFFAAHMPELKPTAGYYGDARRYIESVEPMFPQLNLTRGQLVRSV